MSQTPLSYKDAGVDIVAGDALVERIKPLAKKTLREGVLAGIGGFGALFEVPKRYKEPVLVSGTDGVGTKLKLAFELNRHDGVGIDLVAMCVNDVVVQGAEPLYFLDYYATGKLDVATAESVIKGIAEACKESGCALLGGETAELPGMYAEGEYDLAGFAVGVVARKKIIDGKKNKWFTEVCLVDQERFVDLLAPLADAFPCRTTVAAAPAAHTVAWPRPGASPTSWPCLQKTPTSSSRRSGCPTNALTEAATASPRS